MKRAGFIEPKVLRIRVTKMKKLTGKVAIVTGASKGIGAAIAKALGSAGAAVVVNYSSSKEGADRVVAEITGKEGKAIAVQGDMSKAADVQKLFAATSKAFGRLDVPGEQRRHFSFGALEAVTEEEFHRQFNTNVLGPILATQQAAKILRSGRWQRDQYQLGRQHESGADVDGLLGDQKWPSTR